MLDYVTIQKSLASREPFDSIVDQVQDYQRSISHIPAMLRKDPEGMVKAWKTLSTEKASRAPKSAFFDPLSLQYALGYKDRRYNLTYETLKRISTQVSLIAAIINTRISQVASFSQPYRTTKSLGFIIRHKEAERLTTNSERRFIQQLEAFISSCGEPGRENPYTRIKRPKFEYFLKQIVRDSLCYDQLCVECVPRNNGIPFEFRAVDASTIRIASPDRDSGIAFTHSLHQRNLIPGMTGPVPYRYGNMYIGQQYGREQLPPDETVQYVQVINGQIENVYTDKELLFGVRNPRTDIYVQGYGFGEVEQLITTVTSILYGEEYNRRFFINGAHPKGILNFKGDNWTPDQLECVAEESLVQTDCGTFEIGHAFDIQNAKDMRFRLWNGISYELGTIFQSGIKSLVRLGLDDGSFLRVTENHRVFVLTDVGEEERFVSDLQIGDILLQNENSVEDKELPLKELIKTVWLGNAQGEGVDFSIDDIGEDLWEVLGWCTRDGNISRNLAIVLLFYNHNKDSDIFIKHGLVLDKYGISFKKKPVEDDRIYWQICHKTFAEFLIAIGFEAGKNTRIPWLIFSQKRSKRLAFLRGLFSANGYVSQHGYSIGITSVHDDVIIGTQSLLNTVGISSYRCKHSNPDAKQLIIRRRELFKQSIGFMQQYKMDNIVDVTHGNRTPSDAVPLSFLRYILEPHRDFFVKEGNSSSLGKAGLSIINKQQSPRILSRLYWHDFLMKQEDKHCELLKYRFVRLMSIDDDGTEMTYDVSIDNKTNPKFIVNGLLTHNSFRRQWVAQVAGTENSHKTPITQSEGLEWVNMQMTNQDMQFNTWLEYLIKLAAAVFLIDPSEVGFDLHGGVSQTPLFESSSEWKLKSSRDRGLKPLLRFIAGIINEIIDRIDDHFVFEFIGLDELTEQEKHDMLKEQINSYMTLNEARRTLDLPDIPGGVGELPLNPVLLQLLQFLDGKKQREEEQAKQEQQQALAAQQGQQLDENGQPIPPGPGGAPGGPEGQPQGPDELTQTKTAAAQQKMQMQANKHPLELAFLKQKILNGGGQIPPELEQMLQGQQRQPGQPGEEEQPAPQQGPQYTDLVGKSVKIDFDTWLDQMRSKL